MLHHQRGAQGVDLENVAQVGRIQLGKTALRLACIAMQKAGGDD